MDLKKTNNTGRYEVALEYLEYSPEDDIYIQITLYKIWLVLDPRYVDRSIGTIQTKELI